MLATSSNAAVRHRRGQLLFLLAVVVAAGALAPAAAPAAVAERPAPFPVVAPDPRVPPLWMPVAGAVVRGFDARAGPYGRGHRGIDIAAPVGERVLAPSAGRVVFSGPVAGTTWVSLLVAPGVQVTLGPLLDPVTAAGQVQARSPVGRVGPGHAVPGAGPGGRPGAGAALHLSVRVDGVYVDPLAYLVDRPRPRLAPLLAPGGLRGA